MLKITIPSQEFWDEEKEQFLLVKETHLQLEHSLISISKWESKWHKSFFKKDKKTNEEIIDYIRMMTLTQNVDPNVYNYIPPNIIDEIVNYIDDPMTATWINDNDQKKPFKKDVITSEIIYYWMISFNIPFECQKWHINRLITLIRVCSIKSQPNNKMSKKEILKQQAAINAARRKAHNSKG